MRKMTVVVGGLLLILGLSVGTALSQDQDRGADQRANQVAQASGDQPHMAAALEHLRQAADELEKASHDKGGHRAQALQLTHQAMTHVEEGIKYDRQHPDKNDRRKR